MLSPGSLLPAVMVAAAWLALGLGDARGDGLAIGEVAPGEGAPALPGPAPRPGRRAAAQESSSDAKPGGRAAADVQRANEECAACHAEIAEEWRSSLHKKAWVDPVFQKAYAIEPVAFCRGCHAPEASPASEPGAPEQAVGVGCTTCHVEAEGSIVGPRTAPGAPHGVMADARLATSKACAACHQFNFPGEKSPMQDTAREHARSSFASTECQACHMPVTSPAALGGGPGAGDPSKAPKPHRSHAFSVIGDPAMIRRAAVVTASRSSARVVEITVAPASAGHAFPTGDMFRRVEVRAEAIDGAGRTIARAEPVFLGRTFVDKPRDRDASLAFHRAQASDTRVPPPGAGAGRKVELAFARPVGAARVRWRVLYQRMGSAMAASFGVDQAIDEVTVGEGDLPPFELEKDTGGGVR